MEERVSSGRTGNSSSSSNLSSNGGGLWNSGEEFLQPAGSNSRASWGGGAELKGVWGIYREKSMGQIPMNSVQILWDLGPVSNTHKKDYPRH
jgi:hypothetical protein